MSQAIDKTNTSDASPVRNDERDRHGPEEQADYQRRLRAAGLGPDTELPENMDAFRYQLARQIAMFLNQWHGCPEPLCQRNRGCMAPHSHCANAEPLPPDPDDREWHTTTKVEIWRILGEILKERAAEVEAYEEEELRRVLAKRRQGKAAKA